MLAKHMKPFLDAKLLKNCMKTVKYVIKIQIYSNLILRVFVESSILEIKYSIQFCSKNNIIKEDFLKVVPMKSQTRGMDYFETISTFFEKNKIN
ncbi:general transcription factor II-I repeat domain-containing protein 2B-like [Aphis craccivora]|uniref:General transcription factor II-I repeat domain-containing protein 2B-like n=1 Tax=Aphis craccivora TaxID=307492 RepID=A0A6G0ZCF1_APHCR|nr:general transcription factor II-I repeat domain-containing protein 2B-like [Aphis craccivora]